MASSNLRIVISYSQVCVGVVDQRETRIVKLFDSAALFVPFIGKIHTINTQCHCGGSRPVCPFACLSARTRVCVCHFRLLAFARKSRFCWRIFFGWKNVIGWSENDIKMPFILPTTADTTNVWFRQWQFTWLIQPDWRAQISLCDQVFFFWFSLIGLQTELPRCSFYPC